MLRLEEFTYKIEYVKNDGSSGVVYYTVMAINDHEARYKAADKFKLERDRLINTVD